MRSLAVKDSTQMLIGSKLHDLLCDQKTKNCFLSDDSLAYSYLSHVSFEFIFKGIDDINVELLNERINKYLIELSSHFQNDSTADISKTLSTAKNLKNDILLNNQIQSCKEIANDIKSELPKFRNIIEAKLKH